MREKGFGILLGVPGASGDQNGGPRNGISNIPRPSQRIIISQLFLIYGVRIRPSVDNLMSGY